MKPVDLPLWPSPLRLEPLDAMDGQVLGRRDFSRERSIDRRWPRFRWDGFGRPRLQIWTASHLSYGLGLAAMLASTLLELYWRRVVPETSPVTTDLIFTPIGSAVLILVLLVGAWLADRYFELVTTLDEKPLRRIRVLRFLILTIPLIGILAGLALYRFTRGAPRLRRKAQPPPPLILENPHGRRLPHLSLKLNHLLRAAFQPLWALFLWMAVFQVLPYFAALDLLGWAARSNSFSQGVAGILCILLRLMALGAFLIFVKERQREVQLERRETIAASVVLLATLFPFPISLAAMLLNLFFLETKPFAPESTSLANIYKTRFRIRAVRATSTPLVAEIYGETELRRSRFYTLKITLLVLEVTVLAWFLAPWSGIASLSPESWVRVIALSPCVVVPGVLLWMMRYAVRFTQRWPRLEVLATVPHCTFYALVPLVIVQAFIGGSLAGLGYREALANYLLFLHLETLCIGLVIGSFRSMTALLTRAPTPRLTCVAVGISLSLIFLVAGAILGVPAPGARVLIVGRDLGKLVFLASPLAGLAFGSWLLRSFSVRHLFDRRVPHRVRAAMASFAIPAVLPLGGLAIPVWIFLRHRLGSELDRWVAQLRSS